MKAMCCLQKSQNAIHVMVQLGLKKSLVKL